MKLHEYQGKELAKKFGVPIQRGQIAFSHKDVRDIANGFNGRLILKAQVHAGGRGKAGGIRIADNPEQAEQIAKEMFGMKLVTPQTGAEGKIVRRILITDVAEIKSEMYVGIVLDRSKNQLILMASTEGGVEIEKVAKETPEKIIKVYIDRTIGLQPYQARQVAFSLGLDGKLLKQAVQCLLSLFKAYKSCDFSLVEINPLIVTNDDQLLALDLKVNIDDNALYRHPDIMDMRDIEEEDALEVKASNFGLSYIRLDGSVGCMVNGAGLAMATMDIIKLAGTEPANFLDVGGSASAETVENGFEIILSDKNVKSILVNIFGGIVRCDRVAKGIIKASKNIGVNIPVVVRLAGTNAEQARSLLESSELQFLVADDLSDAAEKIKSLN